MIDRLVCSAAFLVLSCWNTVPGWALQPDGEHDKPKAHHAWKRLLNDVAALSLPTGFLKEIPPDFVRFEFDDLRTYAAEYHLGEHRMVLNRPLSLNAAGGSLRPLARMTHKELEVLYHELFHAYMDFLSTHAESSEKAKLLMSYARAQQACRYGEVAITPIVQRMAETETRYLTESEAWEALNETWAVFVGWAIWNQLEVQALGKGSMLQKPRLAEQWRARLEQAVRNGELRGYYVPQDPEERRVTHKRFLAKQSQISWGEMRVLMREVLGFSEKFTAKAYRRIAPALSVERKRPCEDQSDGE
jgi:hypothetical protein